MRIKTVFSRMGAILLPCLFLLFCNNKTEHIVRSTGNSFAVVELFTSEGCSSCPPADEAMIRLAKEFPDHVYFIGYHVDYWNYIGWKDPYSDASFTDRQQRYADVFGLSSIYTPQAVINGKKEIVGSKEGQLRSIIQQELKDSLPASIELKAALTDPGNISVAYNASGAGSNSVLNIALVQLAATTSVKRGENSGHTLNHINIVRSFKTTPVDRNAKETISLKIPAGLEAKEMKLIAFLQDKKTMKITGATASAL